MTFSARLLFIALCLAFAATPSLAQQNTGTIRVAGSGADNPGCGSIASPCRSLQFAVEEFPLDSAGTIRVAGGTYTSNAASEVVRVQGRRLAITGGYDTTFGDSDPEANPVVIDGQNARRGISVGTAPGIVVNQLVLSGVTITRGRAPAEMSGDVLAHFGGGIDAGSATILLIDVRFLDNHAIGDPAASGLPGDGGGGAVNLRHSDAFLSRVHFAGNSAIGGNGSGAALRGGLGVGGAVFSYDSRVTLNSITAFDNVARAGDAPAAGGASGNGQRADGLGGFWASILGQGSASHVRASGNRAEGGDAGTLGGLGIGGAVFIEATDGVTSLRSFDLRDNLALGGVATGGASTGGSSFGGAVFATDSRVSIEASQIVGNTARGVSGVSNGGIGVGGGVATDSTRPRPSELFVSNTVIARNSAEAASGGPSLGIGGGIFLQCPEATLGCPSPSAATSVATLRHVTLAENTVSGGLYNQGAALYVQRNSSVDARYGIVSGHAGPADPFGDAVIVRTPALVHFERTLWHGNTLDAFAEPPNAIFENVAPVAGSPAYLDAASDPPDFRLALGSAAIDQALGSAARRDLEGEFRTSGAGAAPDLGADERTTAPADVPAQRLIATVFDDGTLLQIDPASGNADGIGSGPIGLVGLAAVGERLFGLWEIEQLIELDPLTGAAIRATLPGIGSGAEGAFAIRADGRAMAFRNVGATNQLWSFDALHPGDAATLVSNGAIDRLDGLAFAPDEALFALSESGQLFEIAPDTGAATSVGATGIPMAGTAGLAFSAEGTLFAAAGTLLYTIDPGSAAPSPIGEILAADSLEIGSLSGITFVPEASVGWQGLLALGVLLALAAGKRSGVGQ